jgi:hypothetical protein
MSEALRDPPDAPPRLRAVNVRDPIIELVTTTGCRERAMLIYRSAAVDEGAGAELGAAAAGAPGEFEFALQDRQWAAQLVTGIGDECPLSADRGM